MILNLQTQLDVPVPELLHLIGLHDTPKDTRSILQYLIETFGESEKGTARDELTPALCGN